MPSLLQHIQLCVIKIHLALVVHDRGDHCAGSHLRDFLQRCGPCRTSLGYCNAKQRVPIHSKSSKRRINSGGAMARGCATIVVGNELLVKCFRLPLRDAQAPGTSIIIIERCSSAHISLTHSPADLFSVSLVTSRSNCNRLSRPSSCSVSQRCSQSPHDSKRTPNAHQPRIATSFIRGDHSYTGLHGNSLVVAKGAAR
jgi:hypothetical protein